MSSSHFQDPAVFFAGLNFQNFPRTQRVEEVVRISLSEAKAGSEIVSEK
jgi:hypothetical protein